jgi:GTP-binding protein
MQARDARFIISAVRPEQFPREELPEFAFLGRSNVGKSSLLNALVGQKGLARVSATPGRTQSVNFFRVADKVLFVDLPGYGYARVPRGIRDTWRDLVEAYLTSRTRLVLCFLLLDARRGWMESDLQLKDWLDARELPYVVVATKFDKLKTQSERLAGPARIRKQSGNAGLILFSAVTGQGVNELWQTILKTPTKPS